MWEWGLLSSGAGAFHCGGFSCCRARALGNIEFSRCGLGPSLLQGMWDLPESGISPCVSCIGRWIFYHWATSEARVIFQFSSIQFTSLQLLSHVWLLVIPWAAACQASLSITISWSLLKFMSIESVMLSNHLVLCRPLLLLLSIFPSISVFSNESALCIRWPKYRNFSYSISSSNEYSGLISFRMDWLDLLAV